MRLHNKIYLYPFLLPAIPHAYFGFPLHKCTISTFERSQAVSNLSSRPSIMPISAHEGPPTTISVLISFVFIMPFLLVILMIDFLLLDVLLVVQYYSAVLLRSLGGLDALPSSNVNTQANGHSVRLTNIERSVGARREDEWMTEITSDFSSCFCRRCHTYREATGSADATVDAVPFSQPGASGAAEEAVNDRNFAAEPSRSSVDRRSQVQTDNSEAVESGEAKYHVELKFPAGGPSRSAIESAKMPEIPQDVSEVSSPSTAIDRSQLPPTRGKSQDNKAENPKPIEPAFSMRPVSPLSTSTFDPTTAFRSLSSSEEVTSSTANQGVADSSPASLLQVVQNDNSIQALAAPSLNDSSARALRPPLPRLERRSSDGFSTFASRSTVFREMLPFGRKLSRAPTPQFDHEPNTPTINGISVAVDESRMRDLLVTDRRTAEKPRWQRCLNAPFKGRKRNACTCETGHPSRCRLHKKPPYHDSTPPRFCESPEGEPSNQLLDGSWILPELDFGADLERQLTQGAHAYLTDAAEDEIGVARPLGPEYGVLAQPRRSEDVISEISELDLSGGSWHHEPHQQTSRISFPLSSPLHLRGGARRNRFQDPRGDNAPINPWLWWFVGGRPLARDSGPVTRGYLRDWRRRSAMTDNGVPRGFRQEFVYSLTGGRWGSGRARRMREGQMGTQVSRQPLEGAAGNAGAGSQLQGAGVAGLAPGNGAAPAGTGGVAGDGLGE
jgi:hypothetical protein